MRRLPKIALQSSHKQYKDDLDKTISPKETCKRVGEILSKVNLNILSAIRRVDTGRLGIPVYLSVCGTDALEIMPTRKQMGKGSSPEQAQASALMELMERFAFFSFWERPEQFKYLKWSEAKALFQEDLIPLEDLLNSVNDNIPFSVAESLLDIHRWAFFPATRLNDGKIVWIPLDWFRMLGEFNGSSAGNSTEESILQGLGELVERHVSCLVDREKIVRPTINQDEIKDPKLNLLIEAFKRNGVHLVLKDFSCDMPLPTVAALAWDPNTFPKSSEIVFTAGTASSPAKAAIRAITEVAQLAGDFHTNSCYEASGLSKYKKLEDCQWILEGPEILLEDLPSVENNDIKEEISKSLEKISPVYAVETTHPLLKIPAHYCVAPGLQFRERAKNQSLGLFVCRKLVEEKPLEEALISLNEIERLLPNAPFLPFFYGLAYLNNGFPQDSLPFFKASTTLQEGEEERAMAEFYSAFALSKLNSWEEALPYLEAATSHCDEIKEYYNLLGVANFKLKQYERAERAFSQALGLDKGSAMDLANRGICRKIQGKKKEAREDLKAALELDPSLDFAATHLEEIDE